VGNKTVEFASRFEEQGGEVSSVAGAHEAVKIINKIIGEKARGKTCCAPILLPRSGSERVDISPLIQTNIPFQGSNEKHLGEVDVGVTRADYAVAETGSAVELAYDDALRLVSSLSRIHIVVVEEATIVSSLQELGQRIRELLTRGGTKPTITLIGGPSRTSDIELKSVLGVHGPKEVYAILVREGSD